MSSILADKKSFFTDESQWVRIQELVNSVHGYVNASIEKSRIGERDEMYFLKRALDEAVDIITSNVPPSMYEKKELGKILYEQITPVLKEDTFTNGKGEIIVVKNEYLGDKWQGKVTKIIKNDSGRTVKYKGNAIRGKFEGHVVSEIDNGDRQESTMKNDVFDGFSLYTFADGSITYDCWRKGKKHGMEILLKADESLMYWKEWKDGVKGSSKLYKPK